MTLPDAPRVYQAHRDSQVERILDAAEGLFIRDGIDRVSLSAIAEAAKITRKTIYQYFPDKREVAWAIFERILSQWTALEGGEGGAESGFERLRRFTLSVARQLQTSRQHLRFVVEMNALYAREASAERMRALTAGAEGGGGVAQMVRQGLADGSIRAGLDPELTAAALLNLLSGMSARFALLYDLIPGEYGLSAEEIYAEICRAFLRGIQSDPIDTQA